jgi:hypothetical protein
MVGHAAKQYPKQYFMASAFAATGCYPLWRSAAIGQSGFNVGTLKAGGMEVPSSLVPYIRGFLPPYKGALATVFGMTYARAAIFYLSDYGHEVLAKEWGYDEVTATVVPPLLVSTIVQITNQPVVRATVTLQDPAYEHPNVWRSVKHIYRTHGMPGLWHGTTAGVLKTVPKYCTAIAIKDWAEKSLPLPERSDYDEAGYDRAMLGRSALKSLLAGVAGAALTNPLDVIRNEQFKTDKGLIETSRALYREMGWGFAFRGLGKNMIAVALPIGLTIFSTDALIQWSEQQKN